MPASSLQNVTLADALADVERRMIADALRKHGGNISRAARELDSPARTLPEVGTLSTQRQRLLRSSPALSAHPY